MGPVVVVLLHPLLEDAIIRGKNFVVPRGNTTLDEGDEVVLVGTQGAVKDARDLLLG